MFMEAVCFVPWARDFINRNSYFGATQERKAQPPAAPSQAQVGWDPNAGASCCNVIGAFTWLDGLRYILD